MMQNILVEPTNYFEVSAVWRDYLWDERYKFQSTSAMIYLGGYDSTISEKYEPFFFRAVVNNILAGVISGHQTSERHFRVRGLFVFAQARGYGISQSLLRCIHLKATQSKCLLLWSAPRFASLASHLKYGFEQRSGPVHKGFLYGPNYYVSLKLD